MGSRCGLPVRPAPSFRCIIAQTPGCFQARGPTPTPVGVVPPPVGPSFKGGTGWATVEAVVVLGGGTAATTVGVCWATGGASLRSWLVIPFRGTVGPAVSRTAVAAGTIIIPAPVASPVPPSGGGGPSVGGFRGSSRRLGGRHGMAIILGVGRARRRCLRRRRRPSDRVRNEVESSGLGRQLRGPLGGRRVLRVAV